MKQEKSSNTNNPSSFDWSNDNDCAAADKPKIKDVAKGIKILPPSLLSLQQETRHRGRHVGRRRPVIKAYANAGGHSKEAIHTFDRMLASGISPNAYTHTVLVKGLARDSKISEAWKYLREMMSKGIRPNAPHSTLLLLNLQPPNSPASFHSPTV
ncbi:hypothetical protein KSP39_PZI018968 [Platanthera zijinensis]|uniref:Pentatricopeptide repeat-containing protein n=1 Tax=Platanthera zijinensis TaxID=2320716 RepID=A0AAP0FZ02_9ASPA